MNPRNYQYSGVRPVMFYQDGSKLYGALAGPRIRILYPDGTVEWAALNTLNDKEGYTFNELACWAYYYGFGNDGPTKICKNIREAIRLANEFDKHAGFPKMEFLGEL